MKAEDALQPIPELGEYPLAAEPVRGKDAESIWGDEKQYVSGPNSAGEYSAGGNVGTAHAARGGFKSREEANKWLDTMLPKLRRAGKVHAKDGILSSPFMALAALLAILSHFNSDRVSPSDYNLMTYKPKRKIF